MAGHKGYVVSFMMDVLAGVLTGSQFGGGVADPRDPDRKSGGGPLRVTIDIARMLPRSEFESRLERLIEQIKSVPKATGVGEIFFPVELEARSSALAAQPGILLAGQTWQSLVKLGGPTDTPPPPGARAVSAAQSEES